MASQADILVDRAQHLAHHIVTRALDDEVALRGDAFISATLAVFLEHRIADELREHIGFTLARRLYDA